MTEKYVKTNSLDDILLKFNVIGAYHRKVALLVFIAFITNSIYCVNYVFVAADVDYRCKPNRCEVSSNLTPEACVTHVFPDDDVTCSRVNHSTLEKCQEWNFEDPHSFVAEFGIACQHWKRTLVGTVHSVGYMVGLLIVGPISDRIGRKNALISTGVIGAIIGVTKSFVKWYWLYIALEFLEASIGDICSPIFMLAIEIVATSNRPTFYMITQFGYPIGGMILALIAWGVPYFRTLLQIIYAPAILFILYFYLIDESPRWLLTKGRKDEAIEILKKAAQINGIILDKAKLDDLTCGDEKDAISFGELLRTTFRSKVILKRFLVCLVWWTTCTFTSYGLSLNSVSLNGNKYLNFMGMCLAEIVGGFLTGYCLNRWKRKLSLLVSFLAGAVFLISNPFMPTNLTWLSITLYMFGKMMTILFFNITYVFTSELFPTYTRNSMHALCSSMGRIGSIVATQTPLLMVYWSGLPSLLFGAACLTAALATLLVPDTGDTALPDTVQQAELVGDIAKIENTRI